MLPCPGSNGDTLNRESFARVFNIVYYYNTFFVFLKLFLAGISLCRAGKARKDESVSSRDTAGLSSAGQGDKNTLP